MKISDKTKGYILGSIAGASYGLNPLCALPLYRNGMGVDSVLFYRYTLAIIILAIMMKIQKQSFAIKKNELLPLIVMGLLFSFSSIFLFLSYNYMDVGIASTILFVYPVMVAMIMTMFFREKVSMVTIMSIVLASCGISLLCRSTPGVHISWIGVLFVILSSLSYAIYIVGVNKSVLKNMQITKLTLYVLLFGSSIYIVRTNFMIDLQPIPSPLLGINILALAFLPTVVSLITMTKAIHYIGSTPTAILGALEPVTAVIIGVMIFGEKMTPGIVLGILLVLIAVLLVITGRALLNNIRTIHIRHHK